jgi:hypothetical protein
VLRITPQGMRLIVLIRRMRCQALNILEAHRNCIRGYRSLTEIPKVFPELGPTLEQPTANEDVRMLKRFLVWHFEAVP